MAAIASENHATLKLVLTKQGNKVLFAEAQKDFVDVLFSFLTLPLGTITRLVLKESNMPPLEVASLSSLYQSVEDLHNECLCADAYKEMLLRPTNPMEAICKSIKLNIYDTETTKYFVCDNLHNCRHKGPVLLSTSDRATCRCGYMLRKPISLESSDVNDGFVKRNASFFITDELKVVPNSLDAFFSLLKNSGIEDTSLLNEMTVTITKDQVLDLLKICLHSKTCLTEFFLKKPFLVTSFKRIEFPHCDFKSNGSGKINVKIVQRKSNGKILFAQGKEDFANFLFSFLTIPLGVVVHLMQGYSSVGSIDGLYKSVIESEEDFWATKELKNKLVNPVLGPQNSSNNMILPIYNDIRKYFCCTKNVINGYLTAWYLASTRTQFVSLVGYCTALKLTAASASETGSNSEGYVKGPILFMATDDLVVRPMSSICVMSLLNSMSIPVSDLEEKEISIGFEEGLRILQGSFTSKSALSIGLSHLLTKVEVEN